MPIYLAHGFRWPRDGFTGIRVHAIIHNLEPVSVEYIQNPQSRLSLLSSLRTLFPEIMKRLEISGQRVDFLEQYDPYDTSPTAVTQPYAFVCDRIAMIGGGEKAEEHLGDLFQTQAVNAAKQARLQSLSSGSGPSNPSPERSKSPPATRKAPREKTKPMSVEKPFNSPPDIRALSANLHDITTDNPIKPDAWDALAELRDQLAKGETIGWWVVYNGDPERAFDPSDDEEEDGEEEGDGETETGDSVDEGVTEIRPKASATLVPDHPRALAMHGNRLSAEGKEVLAGPVKQQAQTRVRHSNYSSTPVKSPTGGRIPPPVPPPPKSARNSRTSQNLDAFPRSPPGSRDKELPPSPAEFQQRMHAQVQIDNDLPRALAKEKDGAKKESLRKKFFGKKGSG